MSQSVQTSNSTRLIASDTEAIRIAKNIVKLLADEIEQNGTHAEFCRDVLRRARNEVRKGGSVRGEPI